MANKISVGDKVWLKPYQFSHFKVPLDGTITKVGRKYIEVNRHIKFDITNNYAQVTNYSADWKLYFSHQDLLDDEEKLKTIEYIRKIIGQYGVPEKITLAQLRFIKEILEG